jgi:hypothetical protein
VKTCIAALAFLGAVACATTGVDPRLEYTYNSSVTGVIVVPEATASQDVCNKLNVYATVEDAAQPIGRTSLHSSKNRCSYQIDNLPSDRNVNVKVETADLKCQDGTPMAFASDLQGPLTLKSNEGKLQDFRAQCGATKS